jgi:transposase
MSTLDARFLSPAAQEDLRRRVVKAIREDGLSQSAAARTFDVSRTSVMKWLKAVERGGVAALRARIRGRRPEPRLKGWQAATIVKLISVRTPDQLRLPFMLWTREAVRDLIEQRFGISVSPRTAGRYLARWGFTPQKPVRRAYEQNPRAVKRWLQNEYPAIRAQAKREKAVIHWGDEMGLRSDYQAGRSYSRRGQTPVVPGTGKRFSCNVLSSITNRGRLAFLVFRGKFSADVMIKFLQRLIRNSTQKVFLIVDSHPVHRSAKVMHWAERHAHQLRLFHLPTYSPELNPDELLNQDVKVNAVGRSRPRDLAEMEAHVRSYLRRTQGRPAIVRSYFEERHVKYAAHR